MAGPPVGQDWYTNLCDTGSGGDCLRSYFVGCDQFGRTRHRLIRLENHQDPRDLSHYRTWNKCCLEYFGLCVAGLGVGSGVFTGKHAQKIRTTYGIRGNHCGDIATGIFCQPCSLIRNDLEIRRRQSDKEGHELGPVRSPPVPLGEEGFRPMYSMPVTEGYQAEPLMTTPSSGGASRSDGESHPSEPLMTTASSIEASARGSHSHPPEHLVASASSVVKSTRGSHTRVSHSHPSETLVPTSSPVTAFSHAAHIHQYAEDFTIHRVLPMYPTEEEAVEYERYWEESDPLPQSPQEDSPIETVDIPLNTLDRRAQILTPISEGDSLEDTRAQRKENRLQFPQIRHWLKGMNPQPDKSPVDTPVLTPGPGTSPVIHEQHNVMSQRGSPSSDTSGRHKTSHGSHISAKPSSKAKTSIAPTEPQRRPSTQVDVWTSCPDILAASPPGSQQQRSLQAESLMSSSYSIVPSPSPSQRHRSLQVGVSISSAAASQVQRRRSPQVEVLMASTPASQHSHSMTKEALEDIPDEVQQHAIWADPEVPAAINSPIPVRGISPGTMFEFLTLVDPEDCLVDVEASPENVLAPSKDLGVPSEYPGVPSEEMGLPAGDLEVPADDVKVPTDDDRVPFEVVGVPADRESAGSFSWDDIISAGRGSNRQDTVESDEILCAKRDTPVQEGIVSTTPVSAPEPQSEEASAAPAHGHDPPTRPQVLKSDVSAQERIIEMDERLPTPELTRNLGDEIPQDQPVPKPKGWAQRAASPVFTLTRQYSV